MKKLVILIMLFIGIGVHAVKAQYWVPNFVEPEYVTISSKDGISVRSITPNQDNSYTVVLSNGNRGNQGEITESNFVEIASNIVSKKTTGCMFGRNCQDNFFPIAPTGDVMPCGRFCDDDLLHYSYGNLHEETLSDILPRIKQSEIYKRSEYIEKGSCKHCKWLDICHGGCLHDGFLKSGDFRSKTFLCASYKKIFAHIEKRMLEAGMS